MFYSPSTSGFYSAELHGSTIPADAVEISSEEYAELLAGQSCGMIISSDGRGRPALVAPMEGGAERYALDIAARRYQAETAGISVNGVSVDTGRDSQALITGASLAAMRDSSYSVKWKTANGFVQLGAEQILAVADAVRAHVQACFDREAVLLAAVTGNTYTADMLDEGWPT